MSDGIENSMENLLQCDRGYWQPSEKFSREYWQLMRTTIISQEVVNNSEYYTEGTEHPMEQLLNSIV
jgi:hypothetical protein